MTKKGLTLIELVLAITLMSMVIFTAATVNILGSRFLVRLQEAAQLQQEITRAMLDITTEVKKGHRYWWIGPPACWTNISIGAPNMALNADRSTYIFIQQDRFSQYALFQGAGTYNATPGDYADPGVANSDDVIVSYRIMGDRVTKSVQQINGGAYVLGGATPYEIAGTDLVRMTELEFTRISYNCVDIKIKAETNVADPNLRRELSYITRVVLRGTSFNSPLWGGT